MYKQIHLDAPNIGELEKKYLTKTIDDGFVSSIGPFIPELEKRFTEYIKVKKAASTQNGTSAIHVSLYELGLKDEDEVIIPALTFIATVNPIIYTRAKAVFVDVDVETWNIDPEDIERSITKKTKAIMPVHLYGNPCDMDRIMKIARRYNLFVIEDATESLGAKYRGRHTGTFGDFGCFSFNGNKLITTGGGGMVVGNDEKRLTHIKFLVNQAKDETREYYHPEIGFNYRMTNIEAALGLAQLEKIDQFLARKKRINKIYKEELKNIRSIRFQKEYTNAESSSWMSCIIFEKKIDLIFLQEALRKKRIPTRRIFMPLTEFPPYKEFRHAELDNSYYIYERGLCLPSSTLNSDDDVYYVCRVIKDLIQDG